jgi:serine/threonine protein kinase
MAAEGAAPATDDDAFMQPLCPPDTRWHPHFYDHADKTFAERYLLMHGVGSGKFGKVYEGRDVVVMQPVAVKVMPRARLTAAEQEKTEREWIIAAKLNHPNVIKLRDVQLSATSVFLVFDLASARALFHLVNESGGLEEDVARRIFAQILSGVAYCHAQGVFHRDLKLENLLLTADNLVKITDFGLSKDSTMSNCNTCCGTLSYMAPEVADARVGEQPYDGARADIWSMGVMLYVMRCCAYPFGHDSRGPGGEKHAVIYERIRQAQLKDVGQLQAMCSGPLQDLIRGRAYTKLWSPVAGAPVA